MSGSHGELKERRKLFNKGSWTGGSLGLMAKVSPQLKRGLTQAQKKENWKTLPERGLFGSATLKAPRAADSGGHVSLRRKQEVCWQQPVIPFPIN